MCGWVRRTSCGVSVGADRGCSECVEWALVFADSFWGVGKERRTDLRTCEGTIEVTVVVVDTVCGVETVGGKRGGG